MFSFIHARNTASPRRAAARRAVLGVLFFGLAATAFSACQRADAQQSTATTAAAVPPVKVETAAVTEHDIPKTLRLTGTLRGARETDLAANVAGRVLSTKVERGQKVEKGQILAQVDVRAAALSLAEARVQLENTKTQQSISQADCTRYEQLKSRGVVTDLEYDQVTAKCKTAPLNVEAAEARQRIAAKNVGDGTIRSPFSGVVTERFVEVGEYVQASSRVVSLAEVDELELEFSVPEQHFPQVAVGAPVHFSVAAYGEQTFDGEVTRISGAVRATRDILVEARVVNPDGKLLPGMFADIGLVVGSEHLPAVPKRAVFEKVGKSTVFVVKDGLLEQRVLQTALFGNDVVTVRRGVQPGEQVVTANTESLQNGQSVVQ